MVGIHLYGHAACQQRLVGDVAVQFRERPLRGMLVRATLLHCGFLAMLPSSPLADVGQILQTDEAMRVGIHDAPTDAVMALLLQPSLSPTDHD